MKRRNVLAGLAGLLTAGCTKIGDSKAFAGLVDGSRTISMCAGGGVGPSCTRVRNIASA